MQKLGGLATKKYGATYNVCETIFLQLESWVSNNENDDSKKRQKKIWCHERECRVYILKVAKSQNVFF